MTEQQTAADNALLDDMLESCVDWNGQQMNDAETPRRTPTCGEIRQAAERIKSLQAEVEELNGALRASMDREIAASDRYEADRQRMRDALKQIATMQDGEQAWWARDIANSALGNALNPASKEANDGRTD